MKKSKLVIVFCIGIITISGKTVVAQDIEQEYQTRAWAKVSTKLIKKLKFEFSPEIQFDERFKTDKFILEGGLEYKVLKFLSVGGIYQFVINPREKKETEYLHRYAFDLNLEKSFNRFEPSLRIRYTNYSDEDIEKQFLRYKLSVKYNIPESKLNPFAGLEIYHQLTNNEIYKTRYLVGLDYKIFKKQNIVFAYKFDYYMHEYKNKHIIEIGYKIKI